MAAPEPAEEPVSTGSAFTPVFRVVGSLVAPATLLTALLFYHGWAHANFFWAHFGVDPSLLDLTMQDHLLVSVDALFVPLLGLAVVVLLLLVGHDVVERLRAAYGDRRTARAVLTVLIPVGVQLVVVGLAGVRWPLHAAVHFLVPSIAFGLGVVLLAYATHVVRTSRGPASTGRSVFSVRVLQAAAVSLLVALALFWATVDYALAVGESRARQFVRELGDAPGVVVHSTDRLGLHGPGVEEVVCGPEAAHPYRYQGLRLMTRSGDRYVLLPAGWSPREGVAVVLPVGDVHRLELTVGASSDGSAADC